MENFSANGTYTNCPTERNACTCAEHYDRHTGIHRDYTDRIATYDRMCTKGHEGILGDREVGGGMAASLFQ